MYSGVNSRYFCCTLKDIPNLMKMGNFQLIIGDNFLGEQTYWQMTAELYIDQHFLFNNDLNISLMHGQTKIIKKMVNLQAVVYGFFQVDRCIEIDFHIIDVTN